MAARETESWGRRRANQRGVPVSVLRRVLLPQLVRLRITVGHELGVELNVVPTRRSPVVAAAARRIFILQFRIVGVKILFDVGQLQLVAQFGTRVGHVGVRRSGGRRRKVTITSGMLD